MLRPRNDNPRRLRSSYLDNIAASTFLGDRAYAAMISAMRHPFLNRGINHDSYRLPWSIGNKQSSKGLLASVSRLPADQSPGLCSESLGTSQQVFSVKKVAG
jgi:hypothetical protein